MPISKAGNGGHRKYIRRELRLAQRQKFDAAIKALRDAEAKAKLERAAKLLEATRLCDQEAQEAKAIADAAWHRARELASDAKKATKEAAKRRCASSKQNVHATSRSRREGLRRRREAARTHRRQIALLARGAELVEVLHELGYELEPTPSGEQRVLRGGALYFAGRATDIRRWLEESGQTKSAAPEQEQWAWGDQAPIAAFDMDAAQAVAPIGHATLGFAPDASKAAERVASAFAQKKEEKREPQRIVHTSVEEKEAKPARRRDASKAAPKPALSSALLRDPLGNVVTELGGPEGARRAAQRKMNMLDHLPVWEGTRAECFRCEHSARIERAGDGFMLVGEAATERCDAGSKASESEQTAEEREPKRERLRNHLGRYATTLYGDEGAIFSAIYKLDKLGHSAQWRGKHGECSRCGRAFYVEPAPDFSFTMSGPAATERCREPRAPQARSPEAAEPLASRRSADPLFTKGEAEGALFARGVDARGQPQRRKGKGARATASRSDRPLFVGGEAEGALFSGPKLEPVAKRKRQSKDSALLRNTSGELATEVEGYDGARSSARRKLNVRGHSVRWQGESAECTVCGLSAELTPAGEGFTIVGPAVDERCDLGARKAAREPQPAAELEIEKQLAHVGHGLKQKPSNETRAKPAKRAAPTRHARGQFTIGAAESKYAKRDVKETAQLIRQDIAAAIGAGLLPRELKASVRIERYSMGKSINVVVTAAPGVLILNEARVRHDVETKGLEYTTLPMYSPEGRSILETLESIANQYQRNRSDSMRDVYDVAFSLSVTFDHDLAAAIRRDMTTAIAKEAKEAAMVEQRASELEPKPAKARDASRSREGSKTARRANRASFGIGAAESKYDRNRDVKAIAALIRQDIVDAVATNILPRSATASTTISRSSTSASIRVTVKAPGVTILNEQRLRHDIATNGSFSPLPILSTEGKRIIDTIDAIAAQYNRDRSDLMTDYFNVAFYFNVSFDHAFEASQRQQMTAAIADELEVAQSRQMTDPIIAEMAAPEPTPDESAPAASAPLRPIGRADYEERREGRIDRLRARGERKRREGGALIEQADKRASFIPLGQPILLGHHSERRDRNYREKIRAGLTKGFEAVKEAESLERRAAAAEENYAISSDDPDAINKLRAKLVQAARYQVELKEQIKRARKAIRGTPREEWPEALSNAGVGARLAQDIVSMNIIPKISPNASANVRRIRERIVELQKKAATPVPESEQIGAILLEESDNRVRLYFPDKPAESVRKELSGAGFHWTPKTPGRPWQRMASPGAWYAARRIARSATGITGEDKKG